MEIENKKALAYLSLCLGGNLNVTTLTPAAIAEIMEGYLVKRKWDKVKDTAILKENLATANVTIAAQAIYIQKVDEQLKECVKPMKMPMLKSPCCNERILVHKGYRACSKCAKRLS